MKIILIISLLLLNQVTLKFEKKSDYDYSSYSSVSKDTDVSGQTIESTQADQSAVYITGSISLNNANIHKNSGDTTNIENSEFYGVNAALLVQGGTLSMTGGEIITKTQGGNALVATNDGVVGITGTTITSTGSRSARGLHSTYGGNIVATKVTISTEGGSCATLATDRGEGIVKCTECNLSTKGAGSPLIYSTGSIIVEKTQGTASGAQSVVVEGKNLAHIKDNTNLKCTAAPNREEIDQCGVMLYQSMSGDAESGTSFFTCEDSTVEILESSKYFSTAPMFFITNTKSTIQLTNCNFILGSGIFMSIKGTNAWGKSGSNGGEVSLVLTNENIKGNFVIDNISTLTIKLVKSTIEGTINVDNTAKNVYITLDKDSKIILTGNSYCNSLIDDLTDGSNLVNGSYSWTIGDNGGNNNSANGIFKINLSLVSLLFSILLF